MGSAADSRTQQREDLGMAARGADASAATLRREASCGAGAGEGAPQCREQAMQHADRAGRPRRVARAEDRGDEVLPRLVVEGQARHERQIAPVIVEAVCVSGKLAHS